MAAGRTKAPAEPNGKHEEELERDCGNHEEIDRSRTIHVIAEECLPTLIGIPGTAGHVFGKEWTD